MQKNLTLWTQSPMRRVFPLDAAPRPARTPLTIYAARGETECLQVGLRVDGFHHNFVRAEVGALKGPEGAWIGPEHVDVLHAEIVPVKWPTGGQTAGDVERPAPAFFPDPLIAGMEYCRVGPPRPPTSAVWLRVRVPRNARPGLYRGVVTVTAGLRDLKAEHESKSILAKQKRRIVFSLRVWDFELPKQTALLTTNWFFPSVLAKWYHHEPWTPGFWRLIERVADDMAAHRQNVIFTPLFQAPKEGRPLITVRRVGGRYAFDFAGLDRWVRIFLKRGFRLIEGYHLAGRCETAQKAGLLRPNGRIAPLAFKSAQDPRYEEFLRQFFHALWAHLGRRGWREKYVQHVSDEPGHAEYPRYQRLAKIVRDAAPGIRIIDAIGHAEFADLMDYPVPIEYVYEAARAKAVCPPENIWTYYCCGPTGSWPNRFIDYRLIRVRIITWLCFQKGIPGFLHWGYNFWNGMAKDTLNPWDDVTAHRWPGGDPMVVYPPRDQAMGDALTISIRWEVMREALEDYEYLRLTRALADEGDAIAMAILDDVRKKVVRDWTTHARDDALLETVRRRMGELLARRSRRLRSSVP